MGREVGVEDALRLRDLVSEYAFRVDDADVDGVVELFAVDGSIESSGRTTRGHEDLRAFYREVLAGYEWTFHAVHGQTLRWVDDDTVRGRVGCSADHSTDGRFVAAALRYDDTYVRTPAGWRFGARVLTFGYVAAVDGYAAVTPAQVAVRWPGRPPRPTQWRPPTD